MRKELFRRHLGGFFSTKLLSWEEYLFFFLLFSYFLPWRYVTCGAILCVSLQTPAVFPLPHDMQGLWGSLFPVPSPQSSKILSLSYQNLQWVFAEQFCQLNHNLLKEKVAWSCPALRPSARKFCSPAWLFKVSLVPSCVTVCSFWAWLSNAKSP